MGVTKKPRKAYKPRMVQLPVMPSLRDEFALTMHMALANLRILPTMDHWDSIAQIFNVISLTIENDIRFKTESRVLAGGARAMNEIECRFKGRSDFRPSLIEIAPIEPAVNVVDAILPKLNVMVLYHSMQRLHQMKRVAA
jgi:hypothetical protein